MSIYANGSYDSQPDWFTWHINGIEHASPRQIYDRGSRIHSYRITASPSASYATVGSFREEMYHTAEKTATAAAGRTIVIACSGIDSEAAARLLVEVGADVELTYMQLWFKDDSEWETVQSIARQLNVPAHRHVFRWSEARNSVLTSLYDCAVPATAMNCMRWLFGHHPSNSFFLTGNGAFRKVGGRFKKLAEKHGIADRIPREGRLIPIDLRDIGMRAMAQAAALSGQYYFHISNDREVAALFKNPLMQYDPSTTEIDDKQVYWQQFPDCLFRHKTQPYGIGTSLDQETRMVRLLEGRLMQRYPEHFEPFTNRIIADFLPVDQLFS